MNRLLYGLVKGYQYTFGLILSPRCRFYPTCSEYALIALRTRTPLVAIVLILKRLLKCHPFHPGGIDEIHD